MASNLRRNQEPSSKVAHRTLEKDAGIGRALRSTVLSHLLDHGFAFMLNTVFVVMGVGVELGE
jgi:hypothetical protein